MTARAPTDPTPDRPGAEALVDEGLWWALETHHAHLAEQAGVVRRYRADVAGFAAFDPSIGRPDDAAWADLARLVDPGEVVFLTWTGTAPEPPAGWTTVAAADALQMHLTEPARLHADEDQRATAAFRDLTDPDVPAMLALVAATDPGPFFDRTIELGRYLGVVDDGRLVAMAGERIHPPGFTEVSAVCTDPAARGRGLAATLVRAVAGGIVERGETPFLNLRADNPARSLYERLGFTVVNEFTFRVEQRD